MLIGHVLTEKDGGFGLVKEPTTTVLIVIRTICNFLKIGLMAFAKIKKLLANNFSMLILSATK